ncbi:unnamed protein product [Adineta steineri]|uniref:SMP-30/Gluconolactonase/LRE-like region domain-containing protein n=1 Tax=Adineta steineri TaxID=433720 RepID=A0A819Q3X7_9BILA|nr:unnamed protein product [Adineta steineri]CAF4022290.1 unnamed protein product [Adineta steineri]
MPVVVRSTCGSCCDPCCDPCCGPSCGPCCDPCCGPRCVVRTTTVCCRPAPVKVIKKTTATVRKSRAKPESVDSTLSQTPNRLCEHVRKRKFLMWIILVVVILILMVIIIPTVIVSKKNNDALMTSAQTTATEQTTIEVVATESPTTLKLISTRSSTTVKDKHIRKWKQNGLTIAGGNGCGDGSHQLWYPQGIYVDDDNQSVYVADTSNHRIIQWKYGAKTGEVAAGGNEMGDEMNQLSGPIDLVVDKKDNSLIICEHSNWRVVRWSRERQIIEQILMSSIACLGLAMDSNGDLYVTDHSSVRVRRWNDGETEDGTIIAGDYEPGYHANQLSAPCYIFIDQEHSLYVTDTFNNRVMKWMKDATEGIVVAGGQGEGTALSQLNSPRGVIVDEFDNVYVVDVFNYRTVRWSKGAREGSIVVGGNGFGNQPDQVGRAEDVSFDRQGNLYLVDSDNCRVLRFDVDYD